MTNVLPDLHLTGDSQCFPFYTYDEDGSHRRENITDWALAQFRARYQTTPPAPSLNQARGSRDEVITKWDIFYYVYALLRHHLPRTIRRQPETGSAAHSRLSPECQSSALARASKPCLGTPEIASKQSFDTPAEAFRAFADAGKQLAELHVHYEQQPEYPLQMIENPGRPLNWRVEKMKLSKDKSQIIYNDFLTLAGIPPETFEYRLGNRSALEWVLDQYRVKTDPRSGIVNDPNRPEDPEYIVRLIKKVVTVSLATVNIINKLPKLTLFVQEEQLC